MTESSTTDYAASPSDPSAPDHPIASVRPRRRWIWLASAGVLVVALIAGSLLWFGRTKTFTVTGTLSVGDNPLLALSSSYVAPPAGTICNAAVGDSDLSGGEQVVVTSASGTTVALGRLSLGHDDGDDHASILSVNHCVFTFTVSGVPSGKGPYGIDIDNRGKVLFNEADAGKLQLTLG